MRKVDELKEPPIIGEVYLVPCVIKLTNEFENIDEDLLWREEALNFITYNKAYITPVINNYHNDIGTGQEEFHYHIDTRFELNQSYLEKYFGCRQGYFQTRPTNEKVVYIPMKCISQEVEYKTLPNVFFSNKVKLRKKMINNKCVHKGFDMCQVKEDLKGIKTCPLHGLKYKGNKRLDI